MNNIKWLRGIYKHFIQNMIKHLKQVQVHWKPRVVTLPTLPPPAPPEVVNWQPVAPMTTTPAHRGTPGFEWRKHFKIKIHACYIMWVLRLRILLAASYN